MNIMVVYKMWTVFGAGVLYTSDSSSMFTT